MGRGMGRNGNGGCGGNDDGVVSEVEKMGKSIG